MTTRRTFIKILSGAALGTVVPLKGFSLSAEREKDKWGELLPERSFGKTGIQVTMLGVGGFHIGKHTDYEAQKTIETAIEGGIRFFDTAESYQGGRSEEKMGRLLTPKYRNEIYLMTKTKARDGKTAREHLEGSLRRLNTDYLDLWQVHSVNSVSDVNNRIKSGVFDEVIKAKAEGKVKNIGFTGHVTPEAHALVLEKFGSEMEACQMPINVLDPSYNSFIKNILPSLTKMNYGIIAMKTVAGGAFWGGGFEGQYGKEVHVMDFIKMKDAMHFVWSLPISTLCTGPDNADMLQEKIDLANNFVKLSEDEQEELIKRVSHMAGTTIEYYKE